jgi:transposase
MTGSKDRIVVITYVQRRRRWSVEEKRNIVQETFLPGMNLSIAARKHGMNPSQLFKWRRLMEEGAIEGIRSDEGGVPKSEVKEPQRRVRDPERMLGRKTLENEILKEAVKYAREKNSSRGSRCAAWRVWNESRCKSLRNIEIQPHK